MLHKIVAFELDRRDVDGDLRCLRPGRRGGAGLTQHPFADWNDQAGLLGQTDEAIGWHQSHRRMPPTQQRLTAGDPPATDIDLRLIEQFQLPARQRLAQLQFHRAARLNCRVHLGLEETEHAASVLLGPIQREIGALEHQVGIQPVLWCERDADAGANDNLLTVDFEWLFHQLGQPAGQRGRIQRRAYRRLHDCEFVAAQSSNRVGVANAVTQSPGHLPQQRITGRMAQRVVHHLELIEVEAMQRDEMARRASARALSRISWNCRRFGSSVNASCRAICAILAAAWRCSVTFS